MKNLACPVSDFERKGKFLFILKPSPELNFAETALNKENSLSYRKGKKIESDPELQLGLKNLQKLLINADYPSEVTRALKQPNSAFRSALESSRTNFEDSLKKFDRDSDKFLTKESIQAGFGSYGHRTRLMVAYLQFIGREKGIKIKNKEIKIDGIFGTQTLGLLQKIEKEKTTSTVSDELKILSGLITPINVDTPGVNDKNRNQQEQVALKSEVLSAEGEKTPLGKLDKSIMDLHWRTLRLYGQPDMMARYREEFRKKYEKIYGREVVDKYIETHLEREKGVAEILKEIAEGDLFEGGAAGFLGFLAKFIETGGDIAEMGPLMRKMAKYGFTVEEAQRIYDRAEKWQELGDRENVIDHWFAKGDTWLKELTFVGVAAAMGSPDGALTWVKLPFVKWAVTLPDVDTLDATLDDVYEKVKNGERQPFTEVMRQSFHDLELVREQMVYRSEFEFAFADPEQADKNQAKYVEQCESRLGQLQEVVRTMGMVVGDRGEIASRKGEDTRVAMWNIFERWFWDDKADVFAGALDELTPPLETSRIEAEKMIKNPQEGNTIHFTHRYRDVPEGSIREDLKAIYEGKKEKGGEWKIYRTYMVREGDSHRWVTELIPTEAPEYEKYRKYLREEQDMEAKMKGLEEDEAALAQMVEMAKAEFREEHERDINGKKLLYDLEVGETEIIDWEPLDFGYVEVEKTGQGPEDWELYIVNLSGEKTKLERNTQGKIISPELQKYQKYIDLMQGKADFKVLLDVEEEGDLSTVRELDRMHKIFKVYTQEYRQYYESVQRLESKDGAYANRVRLLFEQYNSADEILADFPTTENAVAAVIRANFADIKSGKYKDFDAGFKNWTKDVVLPRIKNGKCKKPKFLQELSHDYKEIGELYPDVAANVYYRGIFSYQMAKSIADWLSGQDGSDPPPPPPPPKKDPPPPPPPV